MTTQDRRKCPDDGTCHHECVTRCFRVAHCAPLSNVFPGDVWPDDVRAAHGVARKSRIEWIRNGMYGERGCIDGNDVFHLSYPGDWSDDFTLTSPLIFVGDRMGWLGSVYLSGPGPETMFEGKTSLAKARAALAADKARWIEAVDRVKAVAEMMLIEFAKSVLQGVDEPNKLG